MSRRSVTTSAHPIVIRQSLAHQREVIMNDVRAYKDSHNPGQNAIPEEMHKQTRRENPCHGDRIRHPSIQPSKDDRFAPGAR